MDTDEKYPVTMRITNLQKKTLLEFMDQHPQLKSLKVTPDFNYKNAQELWQKLASLCNGLPGARKSWRRWRKTWQDMQCKAKKQKALSLGVPMSEVTLTTDDVVACSFDGFPSTLGQQETPEFVNLNQEVTVEDFNIEEGSVNISLSEPESPPEEKVIKKSQRIFNKINKIKNGKTIKRKQEHSEDSFVNYDFIAENEQRKLHMKEDYYNFKKDYLKQKLKLMKEQTDALKSIASALNDE